MLDLIGNLGLGFATALTPTNLALCFVGCLVGTLIGVLPGRRTDRDHRHAAAAHLQGRADRCADHARGHLLRRAVRRVDDGDPHQRPRRGDRGGDGARRTRRWRGRARRASRSASQRSASFFAGTVATLVIAAIGAPLTRLALLFGPAEYFGLMVLGLGLAVVLAHGSVLKAVIMVVFGLLLATVGTDLETGQDRLTLGLRGALRRHRLRRARDGRVRHRRDPAQPREPGNRATS